MKYAIPVAGGAMSPHFGHCEQFAFFDVDEQKKEITNKEFIASPEHQPGLLPVWLAQNGAEVVIAGGMGSRAQNLFRQSRITVILNVLESDPEKVVLDCLAGTLEVGDDVCDH